MFGAIADCSQGGLREVMRKETRRINPAGFSVGKVARCHCPQPKNYALRAERSQDAKEAADLLGEGNSGIGGID